MLNYLKQETNYTTTEKGAMTCETSGSDCLDLFATIGALRNNSSNDIIERFHSAFIENRSLAMKILFYSRDIRGGLGEKNTFRIILKWLANNYKDEVIRVLPYIAEYGRYDDLLVLFNTNCEKEALEYIKNQLEKDLNSEEDISLLAKWLPSINASNNEAIMNAKLIAGYLKMNYKTYRKTLSLLRKKIKIIENNLREVDYTFDYSKQPSKAMFKYHKAFVRHDNDRYDKFLDDVKEGKAILNTSSLLPYEIIRPLMNGYSNNISIEEKKIIDVTWNSLEDFTSGDNVLVVADGSGSMYYGCDVPPISVATSLAIYFAERNKGVFKNHFISFSDNPRLIEIKGEDIYEKVHSVLRHNSAGTTNLMGVFKMLLKVANKNSLKQEELPTRIYIISDMEFDCATSNNDMTNFEAAKRMFEDNGYKLPEIIFWNVDSRNLQQPVTKNEQGVALVSGCTPRLFSMVSSGLTSPYEMMMTILNNGRYDCI